MLSVTASGQPIPIFATRLNLKRWSEHVLTRRLEQQGGIRSGRSGRSRCSGGNIRFSSGRHRPIRTLHSPNPRGYFVRRTCSRLQEELRDGGIAYSLSHPKPYSVHRRYPDAGGDPPHRHQRILGLHELAIRVLDEAGPHRSPYIFIWGHGF